MASPGYERILKRMEKALALPFSSHSLPDVIEALKAGHMQCFWNDDAVVITEICTTPRRKFLNIFLAAGSLEGVYALQPQITEFALQNGLTEVQATCRLGWRKHLAKRGWVRRAEILTLDLTEAKNG